MEGARVWKRRAPKKLSPVGSLTQIEDGELREPRHTRCVNRSGFLPARELANAPPAARPSQLPEGNGG